jgi:Zn-dependent peptidase ImmA (M78 family)
MNNINISPTLIIWARERAGFNQLKLSQKFPKIAQWESGEIKPTLKQLENFANSVHVPVGYLFLPQPIKENIPISDFRTVADRAVTRPSPDLLDTLYLCQRRQDWYKDYSRIHGFPKLNFIGSATTNSNPVVVAEEMRTKLGVLLSERRNVPNWTEALRKLIACAEDKGILVMASSIVGGNSHRKLNVREFRGFTLSDDLAPVVFLNASDSKSGQMFTLAHELAHLWLGESGVFDVEACHIPEQAIERWCNSVAAEFLMPLKETKELYKKDSSLPEEVQRLAKIFKVSTLVVLRRLFDAGFINRDNFWNTYNEELERIKGIKKSGSGGDFYRTLGARTGKRFARAILASALEGQALFQDAFRLLGIKKTKTFYNAARELGVML